MHCKEEIIDVYFEKIMPKVKEIDIILKEKRIITLKEASTLLDIEEQELLCIMKNLKISKIKAKNFIKIMLNGSSFICEILKREIKCGSPNFYTPKHLSYIYNIDEKKVLKAFEFLNLEFVTSKQIPTILIQIK